MKKIFLFSIPFLFIFATGVSAETIAPESVSPAIGSSGSVHGGVIVRPIPTPSQENGFMQFNNLTIESISSTDIPAEIIAVNNAQIVPLTGEGRAQAVSTASPRALSQNCIHFENAEASNGLKAPCPIFSVSSSSPLFSAKVEAQGGAGTADGAMYPFPGEQAYRIKIDASTRLLLRDRSVAALSDLASGDQINVFGYYNSDGTITAYLVRDITKPIVEQTLQLNTVTLVSVSGNTLAVVQEIFSPCRYYMNGAVTSDIACPVGISAFGMNTATKNVTKPDFISHWEESRKYVVNTDAETLILDRNRTKLTLADLHAGDTLNIYGATADNGQTINADIIRDLSLPPAPSNYNGTISLINSDGSFVVTTDDGRTLTVKNPFTVGSKIRVLGILDPVSNLISSVSQIGIGESVHLPGTVPLSVKMKNARQ